jgi:hypothetical protein
MKIVVTKDQRRALLKRGNFHVATQEPSRIFTTKAITILRPYFETNGMNTRAIDPTIEANLGLNLCWLKKPIINTFREPATHNKANDITIPRSRPI